MTDLQREKSEMRALVLGRRGALDLAARNRAADALANSADLIGDVGGRVVSGFWPIKGEIDLRGQMRRLAERGAELALPAIIDRETLVFRRWDGEAHSLIAARFGTKEPAPDAAEVIPDVMLVPLAAFDGAFNRIGYGAGYYDRAIARFEDVGRKPRLIGVAFDCQRVDTVPVEAHDQPLDAMLTESGLRWRIAPETGA